MTYPNAIKDLMHNFDYRENGNMNPSENKLNYYRGLLTGAISILRNGDEGHSYWSAIHYLASFLPKGRTMILSLVPVFGKDLELMKDCTAVNPDDIKSSFWNNMYLIRVSIFGMKYLVNASSEGDAFDELINFLDDGQHGGLIAPYYELIDDGMSENEIEEYIGGGNEGKYLTTRHVTIENIAV